MSRVPGRGTEGREAAADGAAGGESLRREEGLAAHRLARWEERNPGLRAGVTAGSEAGDLGLASERAPVRWVERVERAARALGARGVVLARQVHGRRVVPVSGDHAGVLVTGEADGLCTDEAGVLLAVTVADCVPVFVLDPENRAVALLHAGWRGTAAGVLEAGLGALETCYGSRPSGVRLHLGPAICGRCYEVGPEVSRALGRQADGRVRLDLRRELQERATELGVPRERQTRSGACTRCGPDHLYSNRGSETAKRMMAFLGWEAGGDVV